MTIKRSADKNVATLESLCEQVKTIRSLAYEGQPDVQELRSASDKLIGSFVVFVNANKEYINQLSHVYSR